MPSFYVMNVAEFAPLAGAADGPGVTIRPVGDYLEVSATDRLMLKRSRVSVRPAIWFAALTGGFIGSVTRFDEEELWLDPAG